MKEKGSLMIYIEPVWGIDNHLTTFFNLTYFELILSCIGLFISSILLVIRIDFDIKTITALVIFLPIYLADALCITLVFIKYQHDKHKKRREDDEDEDDEDKKSTLKGLSSTFLHRFGLFLIKYLLQQTLDRWFSNDQEANYFALISSLLICMLSARRTYAEAKDGIKNKNVLVYEDRTTRRARNPSGLTRLATPSGD